MEVETETDPISPTPDDTKACADCHTTKTPLWRGGPEGPKVRAWINGSFAFLLLLRFDCQSSGVGLARRAIHAPKLVLRSQSLCNACGIRYRKRRRQALGLDANAEPQDQQHKKKAVAAASSSSKEDKKTEEEGDKKKQQLTVELRVVGFGKEVVLKQRRRMRRKKCFSEEERAAVLLMALSSGVIYAS
jgi:hypothetical protein